MNALDGLKKNSAREKYMAAFAKAKRWEDCIGAGNPKEVCEAGEKLVRATAAYQGCLGEAARRSALKAHTTDVAMVSARKACADSWADVASLSRKVGDSDAKREKYRQTWEATFKREYPVLIEAAKALAKRR